MTLLPIAIDITLSDMPCMTFFQIPHAPDEGEERLVESPGVEEGHPDEDAEDDGRKLDADVVRGPIGLYEAVVEDQGGRDARDEGPAELNLRKKGKFSLNSAHH